MKWFKKRENTRLKRFLFNAENKYSYKELVCNWIIIITLSLLILFLICFVIVSQGYEISFQDLGKPLPLIANIFSLLAFLCLITILSLLIIKSHLKRKKQKEQHENK